MTPTRTETPAAPADGDIRQMILDRADQVYGPEREAPAMAAKPRPPLKDRLLAWWAS